MLKHYTTLLVCTVSHIHFNVDKDYSYLFRIALSYISCDSLFIIVIVLCDSNLTIFYDSI